MWKKIQNYEAYSVSDSGEVRNDITGKILKQTIDRDGYHMATLHYGLNGKRRWVGVHRLVAEAFIPNPDGLPIVNHKDENKDNNAVGVNFTHIADCCRGERKSAGGYKWSYTCD